MTQTNALLFAAAGLTVAGIAAGQPQHPRPQASVMQLTTSETAQRPGHNVASPIAETAGDAKEQSAPAGDARAGRVLYIKYGCYQCHGTVGQGAGQFGPRIAPDPLPFSLYHSQLRRPAAFMPIYTQQVLSEQDVANVYAYLTSQPALRDYKTIPMLNVR